MSEFGVAGVNIMAASQLHSHPTWVTLTSSLCYG